MKLTHARQCHQDPGDADESDAVLGGALGLAHARAVRREHGRAVQKFTGNNNIL